MADRSTELWLKKERIEWNLQEIPLDKVDSNPRILSQIRLLGDGKLNANNIITLVQALREGYVLPAIIVSKNNGKGFELVGGAHTTRAHEDLGRKTIQAYVIQESDPNRLDQLRRTANARESSLGFSYEERCIHAMELVERDHLTVIAAATKLSVKPNALNDRLRAKVVTRDLLEEGVPAYIVGKLSLTDRKELNVIKNSALRAATVRLMHETRIPFDEKKILQSDVASAKSEAAGKAVLEKWSHKLDHRRGHVGQKYSAYSKMPAIEMWYKRMEKEAIDNVPIDIKEKIKVLEHLAATAMSLVRRLKALFRTEFSEGKRKA